jgi:hypothetical protein
MVRHCAALTVTDCCEPVLEEQIPFIMTDEAVRM